MLKNKCNSASGRDRKHCRHIKSRPCASMLVKQGAKSPGLMTRNATNFINPITFETPTGRKCLVDTFDRNFEFSVEHVSPSPSWANVVMIAPASANVDR